MHLGEISDRSPVGVVEDILKVVIGLLLGGTADDAHGRPHLDVATALTRQSLGLGDAPGTGLWCFDRVEMHIRVADGELASGLGAAGGHHQRVCVIEGPGRNFPPVELGTRAGAASRPASHTPRQSIRSWTRWGWTRLRSPSTARWAPCTRSRSRPPSARA